MFRAVVLLVAIVVTCATERDLRAQEVDPDFALLRDATIFKIGLVGFAGHISDEELALGRIIASPQARDRLIRLAQNGMTDESKLYALCGLSRVSRSLFDQQSRTVKWSGDSVNVMKADVILKFPVNAQLERWRSRRC